MFVANPIAPSFPTIRYLSEPGPSSDYPRNARRPTSGAARGRRSQVPAIAGVVLAAAALGAGFVGGFTAATP